MRQAAARIYTYQSLKYNNMRKLIFITFLFFSIVSSAQLPGVGEMRNNEVSGSVIDTAGWNISNLTYQGAFSGYIGSSLDGLFVSTNGDTLYTTDSSNDVIRQNYFTTSWDPTALSYSPFNTRLSFSSYDTYTNQIYFSPDGTNVYIEGEGNDNVLWWTLSTAWNISTATYQGAYPLTNYYEATSNAIWFSPDGTKMFLAGYYTYKINAYTLSTPWDITTASLNYISTSTLSQSVKSLCFSDDGNFMYEANNGVVYQYQLASPWDVDSFTLVNTSDQSGTAAGTFTQIFVTRGHLFAGRSRQLYSFTM